MAACTQSYSRVITTRTPPSSHSMHINVASLVQPHNYHSISHDAPNYLHRPPPPDTSIKRDPAYDYTGDPSRLPHTDESQHTLRQISLTPSSHYYTPCPLHIPTATLLHLATYNTQLRQPHFTAWDSTSTNTVRHPHHPYPIISTTQISHPYQSSVASLTHMA